MKEIGKKEKERLGVQRIDCAGYLHGQVEKRKKEKNKKKRK